MRYEVPVFVDRVRPIFTHPVMVLRVWNTGCPVTDSVGVSGERRRVSAGMRY